MRKTLLSALAVIALTAQLTGCNGNTPVEQPNESSSVVSDVSEPQNSTSSSTESSSSSKPHSSTASSTSSTSETSEPQSSSTATTTSVPEVSEPHSSAVSTTSSEPETLSSESNSQSEETSKDDTPKWTETAVSGERYVNTDYISSRINAIQGSNTVKRYRLNDKVTVVAKTDTNYYKLDDGTFIHADYLSESKVEVQQPTQPSGNNNGNGSITEEPKPYDGTKHTPPENAKVLETQTVVDRYNRMKTIYLVQTDGGTYYFDEATGRYFRTVEDATNPKNSVRLYEVFPNDGWLSDWTSGISVW